MSDILSQLECRACETIVDQTDSQLIYTAEQFQREEDTFDVVEYFIVSRERICFPVKKNFFVMAILFEMEYRNL